MDLPKPLANLFPEEGDLTIIPEKRVKKRGFLIGATVSLILGGLTFFCWTRNLYGIELRDAVAVFTCGIICTTLYYHAKNLEMNYLLNKAKFDLDAFKIEEDIKKDELKLRKDKEKTDNEKDFSKQKNAFRIAEEWHKPQMSELIIEVRRFILKNERLGENNYVEELLKEENRKALIGFQTVLNYFENIAVSLKEDIADEDLLKDFFKGLFNTFEIGFKVYINHTRKTNSTAFVYFTELANKWRK